MICPARRIEIYIFQEVIMETFKRLLPTIVLIIFEVVIGIMLIIDGKALTGTIFLIFGVLMLIAGIASLIFSLVNAKKTGTLQTMPLVMSVILIAVGGFFTAASGTVTEVVSTIAIIYGIIMTINGVIKLSDYLAFRAFTERKNGFVLFSAILSIVLGLIIGLNPFGTTVVIWVILGISLLVSAALDIISLFIYAKLLNEHKAKAAKAQAK